MAEESPTPDLVDLVRQLVAVVNKRDLDATMSFFTLDAVWDTSPMGMGVFEGRATVRSSFEDWFASYEEWEHRATEVQDLGNAVTFGAFVQKGRLVGSSGELGLRYAAVAEWKDGKVARITNYGDIDKGRAAAERLAEERGQAMSENLDLVRSIYADWGRGDFSSADWADPGIEFAFVDGPEPGVWTGTQAMAERYGEWLGGWKDFRAEAENLIVVDPVRVLALVHNSGLGRSSGFEMHQRSVANLFEINKGKVTRFALYWNRDPALKDVGLAE